MPSAPFLTSRVISRAGPPISPGSSAEAVTASTDLSSATTSGAGVAGDSNGTGGAVGCGPVDGRVVGSAADPLGAGAGVGTGVGVDDETPDGASVSGDGSAEDDSAGPFDSGEDAPVGWALGESSPPA